MKRTCTILIISAAAIAAASCSKDSIGSDPNVADDSTLSHGCIVLGDKLDNPYTVANYQAAYASLYPTKARDAISTTDLYVRFLPSDDTQLETLKSLGLTLVDHPVDYTIIRDGDYYHDPSLDEESITWQYAVVPVDFTFPKSIRYEVLDECYLSENSPSTKAMTDVDWDAVERESYRLTGNASMLHPLTKGGRANPSGRVTIVDEECNGGQPVGVAGVKVMCNVFVKFSSTYTDRDGYYSIPKAFSSDVRYRLVFSNSKGFAIGFNLIILPASVSTLGKASPEGTDVYVDKNSDRALFRRCVVNNAAWEYFERCGEDDLNIGATPADIRIWCLENMECSSALMLHHGTVLSSSDGSKFFQIAAFIVKLFGPDITLGTGASDTYAKLYSQTVHELAHATHFGKVGVDYWNQYMLYIVKSYLSTGSLYGDASQENSGYCRVGEMWAYYMESKLYQERYGVENPAYGSQYWFHPQMLTSLEDRGLSPAQILAAMDSDVTDAELLKKKLISLYPSKQTVIEQIFLRYE